MKKEKKKKQNQLQRIKLDKCWQCKKYTVSVYKNKFGGYSERCSNKCGPELLGKMLRF